MFADNPLDCEGGGLLGLRYGGKYSVVMAISEHERNSSYGPLSIAPIPLKLIAQLLPAT